MRRLPLTQRRLNALLCILALTLACKSDTTQPREFVVTPGDVSLQIGGTQQFSAVGAPGEVSWSSSSSAIAQVVPQTGFVTAVSRGEAQITAVSGSSFASARVVVAAPPALQLSAPTVEFEITRGEADPAQRTVTITNAGDGTLAGVAAGAVQYSQGQPTGWLTPQITGTAAPYTLTLRASAGTLPAGTYNAVVPVTATGVANSPQVAQVTFRIVAPASIELARTTVAISTTPGGTVQDSVDVTNVGGRPLTGLAASVAYVTGGQNWLTATPSATTAPSKILLTANATGLSQGTHTANVTVSSTVAGVASKVIAVTLSVGPGPAIQLNRTSVPFTAVAGGSAPAAQTVIITNSGGGTLNNLTLGTVTYAPGSATNWLVTPQLSGTVAQPSATITLNVNPAGITSGTHTATVPVQSTVASNSPVNLTVTLTIGPPPEIAVNPAQLTFTTFSGGNVPTAQAIAVTNAAGAVPITGLSFSVTYGSGSNWLTPSWQNNNTNTPATLLIQPNTSGLAKGTYTATVTVSSPGLQSRNINVTYNVSSFSVDIAPLFTQANPGTFPRLPCSGCHIPLGGTAAQRHGFLTGAGSTLVMCKITGGAACPAQMLMPGPSISLIQAWIQAGMPSN